MTKSLDTWPIIWKRGGTLGNGKNNPRQYIASLKCELFIPMPNEMAFPTKEERDQFIDDHNGIIKNCLTHAEYIAIRLMVDTLTG